MKSSSDLKHIISSINGKSYGAYKSLSDKYDFKNYVLSIDHVQGDPFASPSKLQIIINQKASKFPLNLFDTDYKRVALEDYLTRLFYSNINKFSSRVFGSGKSGLISISRCDAEIIERTAVIVSQKEIQVRFEVGFPARGRTVLSKELEKILFEFLPQIVDNTLIYDNLNKSAIKRKIELSEDQNFIRKYLKENDYVAFIANGSVLPRESGISTRPLKNGLKFQSPQSMEIELDLPFKGKLKGMGIKKGITLFVGGGYHGKSTVLKALELGVYNHIDGDGREYVITDESALKVRAEDGRFITNTDISLFINNLPNGKDTKKFSTDNASGSTSQAANIIESIEADTKLFLIDEDTSATNFMIRDDVMQQLVSQEKEPITPFIEIVKSLYDKLGISTILVVGSSGDFFDIADTIIQMDSYEPKDVTYKAKSLSRGCVLERIKNSSPNLSINFDRKVKKGSITSGPKGVKIKTFGKDGLCINKDTIELRSVEQIVDSEQVNSLGYIMKFAEDNVINNNKTIIEVVDEVLKYISENGLISISPVRYGIGSLALPRKQEIIACFNRYRNLKL
ncbi:ABC-ATPase domain-containing protein [uncultured Clostridium sp.]|uniref:ABC-ATPase domain-containing protein n=1 Tax=uncultured Clostridium sp. TaxID=59620 RepID=UPI0025EFC140|nr:ABC-ATPase domain-containing protein [uncultured Clostridium sp.]